MGLDFPKVGHSIAHSIVSLITQPCHFPIKSRV